MCHAAFSPRAHSLLGAAGEVQRYVPHMKTSCLALTLLLAGTGLWGCGSADFDPNAGEATGGTGAGTGGANPGTGGTSNSGGSINTGGASVAASGGAGPTGTGGAAATGSGGAVAGTGGVVGRGGSPGTGGSVGPIGTGGGAVGGAVGAVPLDAALMASCTGTSPILCTIPVPANGNYTVTVELGSASAASTSRVQAETYRIVVPQMALAAGAYSQQTFSVNVRAEAHDGYNAVGRVLNPRIDGPAPALHGLGFAAAPNIPTIFVAGDSTVCDWDPVYLAATPATAGILERGWAQEVSQFFTAGIAVANYSDSGETAPSFYTKFWAPGKAALRAGDYVFIQFGHNDQKTDSSGETTASFMTNLMRYITDARAAQATPVLLTPPGRKSASAGNTGFLGFDQATRDLARMANVALIDLTNLSIAYYDNLPSRTPVFANPTESTHFSETGATGLSDLVTTALKAGTLPLAKLIR